MNTILSQKIIKKSIFDYQNSHEYQPTHFWQTWDEIEYIMSNETVISNGNYQKQFRCFRLDQENEKYLEQITLMIDNDLMSYTSSWNSEKVMGITSLKRLKVEFYSDILQNTQTDHEARYCILLTHDAFYQVIIFKDQHFYNQLKEELQQKCILNYFGEQYTIHNLIYKGKFGKIALAINKSSGKKYAVKQINKTKQYDKLKNQQIQQQVLMNEIYCMRQLDHPSIPKLHQVYEGNDHIYLVMDLIEGQQLYKSLAQKLPSDQNRSNKLIIQLIECLKHISQKQIIHRDIQPQNIIIDDQDRLYLVDFDVSEFTFNNPKTIGRYGAVRFTAPEVLNNQNQTQKVDVFSCGVIIYELLTRSNLLQLDSYQELFDKNECFNIQNELHGDITDLPDEAIDLLKRMLHSDPNQRLTIEQVYDHKYVQNQLKVQSNQLFDNAQPKNSIARSESMLSIADAITYYSQLESDATSIFEITPKQSPSQPPHIQNEMQQKLIQNLQTIE